MNRAAIAHTVLRRSRHLNGKAQQLDHIDRYSWEEREKAAVRAAVLRQQARNLISIMREQLTALEGLCRD